MGPTDKTDSGLERIRSAEAAAYAAWPALVNSSIAGWRARGAQGVTGRANSVWALEHDGSLSLDASIGAVEAFYAEQGLPSRFQINAAVKPAGLDAALEAGGYRIVSPTFVQMAPLSEVLARTPPLSLRPTFDVTVAETFDEEWFGAYRTSESMDAHTASVREAILLQTPEPRAFALVTVDGEPAAVGFGVVSGPWLGVFCMATLPRFRRQGAATALLRALAIWAQLHGAEQAYLQVNAANTAAQAAYAKAGFATAYDYHYRVLEMHSRPTLQQVAGEQA